MEILDKVVMVNDRKPFFRKGDKGTIVGNGYDAGDDHDNKGGKNVEE